MHRIHGVESSSRGDGKVWPEASSNSNRRPRGAQMFVKRGLDFHEKRSQLAGKFPRHVMSGEP